MAEANEVFVQVEGVGTRSIRRMIETNALSDELTSWEIEFSESMLDHLKAWQSSVNWVSANQLKQIERIYMKLYDAGET